MSSTVLMKCVWPRIRFPPSGISRGTSLSCRFIRKAPAPRPPALLLLRWRGSCLVVHHVAITDGGLPFVSLVVLVFHGLADAHRTGFEMQRVIGVGVGREPVLAVDLLAVGFELGKLLVALLDAHALAVGLDDLQVAVVHPDLAFEIAFALHHLLRLHRKSVGADLIHLFAA